MSGRSSGSNAVERDRVERGRQPGRRLTLGEEVETAVGARRTAFAGEHAGRVLVLALEGEHAGSEGEPAGHVLRRAGSAGARRRPRSAGARPRGTSVPERDSRVLPRHALDRSSGHSSSSGSRAGEVVVDVDAEDLLRGEEVLADGGPGATRSVGLGVVAAHGLGDVGEVALTGRRDDDGGARRHVGVDRGQRRRAASPSAVRRCW